MSSAPIVPEIARQTKDGVQERIHLTPSFHIVIERGTVMINNENQIATVLTVVGPNYNNQLGMVGTANRAEIDLLASELKERAGNVGVH